MAKPFEFRQTAISTAIHTLKIPTRLTTTGRDHVTDTELHQPMNDFAETSQSSHDDELMSPIESSAAEALVSGLNRVQRHEQARLVRTIGARMREARDMCNMSQIVAAKALGYANSSKLAKIEGASDTNSVPMMTVINAAKLYDVSTDFLLGLTGDWERQDTRLEDREIFGYIMACREEDRKHDQELFGRLANQMKAVNNVVNTIGPLVEVLERGLNRVKTDPVFEEVRGGAAVLSSGERIVRAWEGVMAAFRRVKMNLANFKKGPPVAFIDDVMDSAATSSPILWSTECPDL